MTLIREPRRPSRPTPAATRDGIAATPRIPGHTLAGSPPGNLLGPSRERRR